MPTELARFLEEKQLFYISQITLENLQRILLGSKNTDQNGAMFILVICSKTL